MTMRRACGFEAGTPDVFDSVGAGVTVTNAQARSGTYSGYFNSTNSDEYGVFNLNVAGEEEWYFQMGVYFVASSVYDTCLFSFLNSVGNIQLLFKADILTNVIEVWRGNIGALLGATAASLPVNEWVCIEVHVVIGDAPNGSVEVLFNGVSQLSLAGIDTLESAPGDIAHVRFGYHDVGLTFKSAFFYLDDFVANDTAGAQNNSWPNQLGLYPVVSSGPGTTTQLTPTAGVNWDNVEETPPDDGNYVYSNTLDQFDTYEATDVTVAGLVRAVIKWGRAKEDVAAARDFAHMWRINGTDYTGGDIGIDTTFDCYAEIDELSPDTGVPFTTGEINAAEIGVKVR